MKPSLSELFLPCSGKHSPMRANRYPLTTITGAQRASGQTHSRARSHQDGADLRADRSTAYLVSCIRVCSAHGNSLDHVVGWAQRGSWGAYECYAPSSVISISRSLVHFLRRAISGWYSGVLYQAFRASMSGNSNNYDP